MPRPWRVGMAAICLQGPSGPLLGREGPQGRLLGRGGAGAERSSCVPQAGRVGQQIFLHGVAAILTRCFSLAPPIPQIFSGARRSRVMRGREPTRQARQSTRRGGAGGSPPRGEDMSRVDWILQPRDALRLSVKDRQPAEEQRR